MLSQVAWLSLAWSNGFRGWSVQAWMVALGAATLALGLASSSVSTGDRDTGTGRPWRGEGDTELCPGIAPGGVFLERWGHPNLMRPSKGRSSGSRTIPAQIQDGKRTIGAALGEGLGVLGMGNSKCPGRIPVPWADPTAWAAGRVGILPR